jgi:hypothetical protein
VGRKRSKNADPRRAAYYDCQVHTLQRDILIHTETTIGSDRVEGPGMHFKGHALTAIIKTAKIRTNLDDGLPPGLQV